MRMTMTKKQKISLGIVSVLLSALLAASGVMIYRELSSRQKEKDDFKNLVQIVTASPTEPSETDTPSGESDAETEPEQNGRNLEELFSMNSDCIGWLCIPGTAVDYPVMHTPENPQKYLRKNFYGEYSQSGVPFLDGRCDADSDNLTLYGHNMKNGTMFSNLRYYTDPAFCDEHRTMELETADGLKLYELFAVLKTDNADEWYNFITTEGKESFDEHIGSIKARSLYQPDITPEYGQQILSLSTCYGSSKNGRLLVIAVQVN